MPLAGLACQNSFLPHGSRQNWLHAAALLALCILFSVIAWPFLKRMGIEVDEALAGSGIYTGLNPVYSWHLSRRHEMPVMILSYLGALKTWICAPGLLLWGAGPVTLRLPTLLAGAATIVLFWRLLAEIADRRAAWAGAVLLATDTTFLLLTTIDFGPVALQLLLKTAALFCFVRWYRTGRLPTWALAWFLIGLALWDKAVFIWIAAGLAAGSFAAFPTRLRSAFRPQLALTAAGACCLGALPLLSFNIANPLQTIRENAAISAGKRDVKVQLLRETLNGHALFGFYTALDTPSDPGNLERGIRPALVRISDMARRPPQNWTSWALLAAIACLPFIWRTPARAPVLFGLVSFATGWLAMFVTAGAGTSTHHVILLWPVHFLAIAVAFAEVSRRYGRMLLPLAVALLAGVNLLVTSQYYQDLVRNGPAIRWTTATLTLEHMLKQSGANRIMVVDWGIRESLVFLSEGSLPLYFANEYVSIPPGHETILRDRMIEPGTVFVSHVAQFEQTPGVNLAVDNFAAGAGYRKEPLAVVRDQHGRPVFDIYQYRR